jgi:NAD(P)-dependent dehydrogenase (short-subunit alcohol dehydrogenase family)
MTGIENKRIIVTGGASGIGEAAVKAFARAGAHVASFDVNDTRGEEIAADATRRGPGTVSYFHADVSQKADVETATRAAVAQLGGLDSLFNIAGIWRASSAESITEKDWDRIFDINVKGTLLTNQAVFPHLKKEGGSIINTGSDAALMPYLQGAHYSASKGAVISFTRTIAGEWGKHGIRANAVVPAIWTAMYEQRRAELSPEELAAHDAQRAAEIPLGGKLGDPDTDLAPVLVFLASDASKFITGQIIPVNGGLGQVR